MTYRPQLIERAVGRLGDLRRTQDVRFSRYRETELTDTAAHDLAIRSLDAGVVPVTRLPALLQEWREPRHPEFRECGKTAWRFFNASTEALKGNLDMLPRRTQALHGLLDTACGFVIDLPREHVTAPAQPINEPPLRAAYEAAGIREMLANAIGY